MKGKFKVLFNVVLCFTAILLAGICVFAGVGKKGCVAQAFGEATEDYSLWDKNTNAIFSVEKVAIEAGENLTETKDFCSPLYTNTNLSDDNVLKKMYSYNFANSGQTPTNVGELERASAVYYDDIRDGTSRKTVVHDNDFVMLNNRPDSQGKYYYSENLTSSYKNGEGNAKMVYMQEAIMVSFGNYFSYTYLDEEGNTAEGFDKAGQVEYTDVNDDRVEKFNSGANIEWMRVSATRVRTGSQTVETLTVPGSRTYQNGRGLQKQDFVWIIPQTEGCEGYYEINVNFSYNGLTNGFTFGFYIVLGSSYNQTLTDNMHNDYSAYPSLKNASAVNGVNHFYLGEMDLTNNNYPTLSYDVTKYALDYVRVANGVSTSFSFNNVEDNGNMRLQSTKTTPSQTYNYDYPIGKVGTKGNIAVVVFTEIGDYSIHFRYKYNNEIAPNMNLQIADIQLSIHGFELKYAKAGFNEAEMRHLTFANNENASTAEMGVGVVVPDGYRSEQESSILETELGVIYDFDRNSTSEVGSLVKLESACVAANSNNLTVDEYVDEEQETGFNIDFAKTNQGSLWFVSTDSFVQRAGEEQGSFYYYGQNLKELKSAEIQPYSNIVSFNQTGYYLVFIKVNAQGVNKNYYSVYAFNYTADTVTVHTEKVDGEKTVSIASDAYTNKSVKIWWEEPGVFEREISVKFLKSKNFAVGDSQTFPSWQELALSIDTQGTTLQNGQIVGGQDGLGAVENGTSAIFLIKLQMVGKSASFRTFTIDKQPITGVQAYAVETKINRLGNVIYSPIKNQDGANVALLNGITDSYATLNWNSKENASGAKISVSYTRTPISPTNAYDVKEMSGWLTTKYTLGKTVGEIDLEKPDLNGELNSSSVLFESGIYLFTLTDEAGNSCRYLFVIDKTENYFKVTEQNGNSAFVTRDSLLYTDQVTVKAGQYKAIELPKTGNEKNDELFEFISAIEKQDGSLASLNYYSQSGTNSGVLASLFKLNGSTHYLTVENRTLSVYNNQRELQHTLNGPTFSYDVLAKGSSNVEQLYLIGANQITTNNPLNSNSYLIVEINTDHALGMAYYGANVTALRNFANLTNSGSNGATRLYYDNNGTLTGLNAAHATGADYLAFSFKLGTNTKYEIKTVGLKYYQLELYKDVQNESFLTNFFYANQPNKEITLYDKDSEIPDSLVLSNDENARAVAILNVVGNKTVEGLYVITREYVTNIEAEGEKDTTLLDYYFLVDRNGVIVLSNEIDDKSINGGYISLGLKNNEIPYSSFTTIGVPSGSIRFVENGATREIDYNVYLTTNRLPLVLNVPFGKYFYSNEFTVKPNSVANMQNGTNYYGSEYFAGRLSFDLYFNDIQGQLSDITTVPVHLLYSVEASGQKGYISYNIKQQLTNTEIKNCFVAGDGEFIALPGD